MEIEWPHREALADACEGTDCLTYDDLLAAAATKRFHAIYERSRAGTIADNLAERFGTKGIPVSVTTACASGATAIQLGVEAIRRGETPAALCVGTDGWICPELLVRFSLLSALSTRNSEPEAASKPFSQDRDGFVPGEGAGALVLENLEVAKARGARILGVVKGCGEASNSFHRTRSSPDGKPIIACMTKAIADAGLDPGEIGYVNAHGTSTPENDKMEHLALTSVFAGDVGRHSGIFHQIDDRSYIIGSWSNRSDLDHYDFAEPASFADHKLLQARPVDSAGCGTEQGARHRCRQCNVELLRLRRPKRLAGIRRRTLTCRSIIANT